MRRLILFTVTLVLVSTTGASADPGTLALMFGSGTAVMIGQIVAIAGPVLQVAGALADVSAEKQQKREHQRAATEARIAANVEAEQRRRRSRLMGARDAASMAEAGVLSGTAEGVLSQNDVAAELDAMMIEYRGEQQGKASQFRASQTQTGFLPVFTAAVKGFNDIDPLNLTYGGQYTSSRGST